MATGSARAFIAGIAVGVLVSASGGAVLVAGLGWRVVPPSVADADVPADPEARRKAVNAALEAGHEAVTRGDWPEAIRHGERALQLERGLSDAHKMLGLAYWRAGQPCRGRAHFEKFVELKPEDPWTARVRKLMDLPDLTACAPP